jgi:hypothetical protein
MLLREIYKTDSCSENALEQLRELESRVKEVERTCFDSSLSLYSLLYAKLSGAYIEKLKQKYEIKAKLD